MKLFLLAYHSFTKVNISPDQRDLGALSFLDILQGLLLSGLNSFCLSLALLFFD